VDGSRRVTPARELPPGVPDTYVPARNSVFLALALALADSIGAAHVFYGATAVDAPRYPDCSPDFVAAFQRVSDAGTRVAPRIRAPLLRLHKTDVIRVGLRLGVDYSLTHSCYDPVADDGRPCGVCHACALRNDAFVALGFDCDPALARFRPHEK
ncbi:unnamed protein product, partial [Agarophyton chilense]